MPVLVERTRVENSTIHDNTSNARPSRKKVSAIRRFGRFVSKNLNDVNVDTNILVAGSRSLENRVNKTTQWLDKKITRNRAITILEKTAAGILIADVAGRFLVSDRREKLRTPLDEMKTYNKKNREKVNKAVSQPVEVLSSYQPNGMSGISYDVIAVGDSVAEQDCSSLDAPRWKKFTDAIANKFINVVIGPSYIGETFQIGADSGKIRTIIKTVLIPNTQRTHTPIYIVSAGPNNVLQSFDAIGNDFVLNIHASKQIIDEAIATFTNDAEGTSDNFGIFPMLLNTKGTQDIQSQIIALLLPDIKQVKKVQDQIQEAVNKGGNKNDIIEVIDYAVIKLNMAIISLAAKYGFSFVNLYNLQIKQSEVCQGDIHPNDEGYKIISQLMAYLFQLKKL